MDPWGETRGYAEWDEVGETALVVNGGDNDCFVVSTDCTPGIGLRAWHSWLLIPSISLIYASGDLAHTKSMSVINQASCL